MCNRSPPRVFTFGVAEIVDSRAGSSQIEARKEMSDSNINNNVTNEDVTKALINLATRVAQLEDGTPLGGELGFYLIKLLSKQTPGI